MSAKIGALLGAALAAMAMTAPGCAIEEDTRMSLTETTPVVIAHRGASGELPEHTIEAYARAIELGADFIEPDLVITRDGVLVARHDRFLSTTTDVAERAEFAARQRVDAYAERTEGLDRADWWIEDFTLAELKTLRARQPRQGRSLAHDDLYSVPTFDEVIALAAASGRSVGLYPETKHPEFFRSIGLEFEGPLLASLENFQNGSVFIQSFEPEILRRLREQTSMPLVQLIARVGGLPYPNLDVAVIAEYADGVGPSKDLALTSSGARTGYIDEAHAEGLLVHVWTHRDDAPYLSAEVAIPADVVKCASDAGRPVGAVFEAATLFAAGADGIFSDFPDTAIAGRNCAKFIQP